MNDNKKLCEIEYGWYSFESTITASLLVDKTASIHAPHLQKNVHASQLMLLTKHIS